MATFFAQSKQLSGWIIGGLSCVLWLNATQAAQELTIKEADGKLRVDINGKLFTELYYQNVQRPYFYPLIGPFDLPMTRNYPMKDVQGEEKDHPHHKSLWFTHGDVNKVDFWTDGPTKGKIVCEKVKEIKSKANTGSISTFHKWIAADGKLICTEDRVVTFTALDNSAYIDFDITIHASNGPVMFGDTKEGSMAIRLAESMRLKQPKNKAGLGHIVNSEGVRDGDTWGKRAAWVDYYGPVNEKTVGVAIFDHPSNFRYPTWWHVRDYGLFAVNPFGIHDFEKKPAGVGDWHIAAGEKGRLRYRFYLHAGDEKQAEVARHFEKYAAEK